MRSTEISGNDASNAPIPALRRAISDTATIMTADNTALMSRYVIQRLL
jgi:hypothetical protein